MKKKTLISIINWNNNLATNACLKSIAAIPKNKQPDIYLIDNHSEKEKLKIDNKIVDKLRSFTFIQNNINLGYAGGHNQAIKYAREQGYDYICLLNNDTELVSTNIFDQLIEALDKNSLAVAASPTIVYQNDPSKIWYAGGKMNLKSLGVHHENVGKNIKSIEVSGITRTEFLTGCCLMIDLKKDFNPLLDESYFLYWEDTDLCARALRADKQLLYVPGVVLKHNVSSSFGVLSPSYTYYNLRNRILFAKKWSSSIVGTLQSTWIAMKLILLCLRSPKKLPAILQYGFLGIWHGLVEKKGALK